MESDMVDGEVGMNFSVNTSALPGLAQLMERRWGALQGGYDYLKRYTVIGQAEGVLNWLLGEHQEVVNGVGAYLERAANDYALPYATAITAATAYYRRNDADAAARLDATLAPLDDPGKHGPAIPPANQGLGPELFSDPPMCQVNWYGPPHDYQADYQLEFLPFDALSPTSDARELIWQASRIAVALGLLDHPYDIIDELVKPLSGDWTAFAACAEVFQHLGNSLIDQASCIHDGVRKIDQVWTGNAADACASGLDRFAGDLNRASAVLYRTAAMYADTAEQVKAQAAVLASVVTTLLDMAIDAGLSAGTDGGFLPL
ncbi:MAG: hypothetical protein J2P15_18255, partial [Micromonosporaceae bacterium]|nr:hypothetical protein [Micromonosporaceae bacterium]